jgi:uncharacterized protein
MRRGYKIMECRIGCGACCIAPSISSSIPGMTKGKPAGVRCIQLTTDNKCKLFADPNRPNVCSNLKPSEEMCSETSEKAIAFLTFLEEHTKPNRKA